MVVVGLCIIFGVLDIGFLRICFESLLSQRLVFSVAFMVNAGKHLPAIWDCGGWFARETRSS